MVVIDTKDDDDDNNNVDTVDDAVNAVDEVNEVNVPNADNEETKRYDLSMLNDYEKYTEIMVQYGLFFFSLCNAGVTLSSVGWLTLVIFCAVVFGKTIGIGTSTFVLSQCCNVPLPKGISLRNIPWLGYVGSMSLTVALFVANVAFQDKTLRQEAKMGALMAASLVMISCVVCRFVCGRPRAMNVLHNDEGNDVELVSGIQKEDSNSENCPMSSH